MLRQKKGFSLIELLAVCLMIAILSSIALPNYRKSVERTRVAEALTLLRAIYDSCERLAWENSKGSCAQGIIEGVVTFPKLDMLAKGTFSEGGMLLTTDNFRYELSGPYIYAWAKRGSYSGAGIKFDGDVFECIPTDVGSTSDQACTAWGASTWNE